MKSECSIKKNKLPPSGSTSSSKSGVALVIVLGVLSLMLILAVSFAVSMRTARLASGNYADTVRARELTHVALARAMSDLRAELGTSLTGAHAKVYPGLTWTNELMNVPGGSNLSSDHAYFFSTNINSATNFVPRSLYNSSRFAAHAANAIEIKVGNELVGRVTYLILNCSGLLDVNFAGNAQDKSRGMGTNPMEIAVYHNPNYERMEDVLGRRAGLTRFETVAEMHEYAGNSSQPSNYFVYSYCSNGWWSHSEKKVEQPVNLAGGVASLKNHYRKAAITNAFYQMGFNKKPFSTGMCSNLTEAEILYASLLDYVDGDSVPYFDVVGAENIPIGVEAVPKFNEFVFICTVEELNTDPVTYEITSKVQVELWYPFLNNARLNDRLQVLVAFDDTGSPDIFIDKNMGLVEPGGFFIAESALSVESGLEHLPDTRKFHLKQARVLTAAGVLETLAPYVVSVPLQNKSTVTSAWECIDPRFNFSLAPSNCFWVNRGATSSWGMINLATLGWWANHPQNDTNSDMYVANRELQTVGELGYLTCGPWKTVKLYGSNLNPVLDFFAIGTNESDVLVSQTSRGLVNPNSRQVNALATLFLNQPVADYPGQPSADTIAWEQATRIANILIANGPYTNVSDIGLKLTNFNQLDAGLFDTEFKKESLLRNVAGLLSCRQNVFSIFIETQVASGGIFPRYKNMAHQRAVAIVWRDPYTGEMFVRSLIWLDD